MTMLRSSRIRRRSFRSSALFILIASIPLHAELLPNPSFEAGFPQWTFGWYPYRAGGLLLPGYHVRTGSQGLYLYTDGSQSMVASFSWVTVPPMPQPPGRSLRASVWTRGSSVLNLPAGGTAFLSLAYLAGTDTVGFFRSQFGQADLDSGQVQSWRRLLDLTACLVPGEGVQVDMRLGVEKGVSQEPAQLTLSFDDASLDTLPMQCGILASPADQISNVGQRAEFRIGAFGTALDFQWYRNGMAIPGANDSVFILPHADITDSGDAFFCKVRFAQGWVRSGIALLTVLSPTPPTPSPFPPMVSNPTNALEFLQWSFDRFHHTLDVYTDADAAGNHFLARGKLSSPNGSDYVPSMEDRVTQEVHTGLNSTRCRFLSNPRLGNWGGWMFLNGVLLGTATAPAENWGTVPRAGVDLTGATALEFWARGETGREKIEFFAFGVTVGLPYGDSAPKKNLKVTLNKEWTRYEIPLAGLNLSQIIGGFGWVASAADNDSGTVTFHLDDIKYYKDRRNEPRFLVSYETEPSGNDFDVQLRNAAFVYDQALALLVFLAAGDTIRADLLARALAYAQRHDRYYQDGRLRNAYQAGDLALPPGWLPNGKRGVVRMPGYFCDTCRCPGSATPGCWMEDAYQVSSHTGNIAWAILALLSHWEIRGDSLSLSSALEMGEWVEAHTRSEIGAGGYTGGYEGYEPSPTQLTYKSTEHNLDLVPVFLRLGRITGDSAWLERAAHARQFVASMWDPEEGKFWTGTTPDGATPSRANLPLDVNPWSLLALKENGWEYWRSMDFADTTFRVGDAYDFNNDRDHRWMEGSAQMALAYRLMGRTAKTDSILSAIGGLQRQDGVVFAADVDGLTTGFDLPGGSPWLYFHRGHAGATAWKELADRNFVNPYWYGSPDTLSIAIVPGGNLILLDGDSISRKGMPFRVLIKPDSGGRLEDWNLEGNGRTVRSGDTLLVLITGKAVLRGRFFILPPDSPPVIRLIGSTEGQEGKNLEFQIYASDPDGDSVELRMEGAPAGAEFSSGLFRWTPSFSDSGVYGVVFKATARSRSTALTALLRIANVDRPPVFLPVDTQALAEGRLFRLALPIEDPDGDIVSLTPLSLPLGAELQGGEFRWTPGYTQGGKHVAQVKAEAGGLSTTLEIPLEVSETCRLRISAQPQGSRIFQDPIGNHAGWLLGKDTAFLEARPGIQWIGIRAPGYRPETVPVLLAGDTLLDLRVKMRPAIPLTFRSGLPVMVDGREWISREVGPIAVADLDRDGQSDLILTDSGSLRYLRNRGDGFEVSQAIRFSGSLAEGGIMAVAVAAWNKGEPPSLLLSRADGRLLRVESQSGIYQGGETLLTLPGEKIFPSFWDPDAGGDGNPKLLIHSEGKGLFLYSIARHETPTLDPDKEILDYRGQPYSYLRGGLSMVDLDGDGIEDMLAFSAGELQVFPGLAGCSPRCFGPGRSLNLGGTSLEALEGQVALWRGPGRDIKLLLIRSGSPLQFFAAGLEGDFDGDGKVGAKDLEAFSDAWETWNTDATWDPRMNLILEQEEQQKIGVKDLGRLMDLFGLEE